MGAMAAKLLLLEELFGGLAEQVVGKGSLHRRFAPIGTGGCCLLWSICGILCIFVCVFFGA